MFRSTAFMLQQRRQLADMLKRFKLAGAHPDFLLGTHPSEASHNSAAMMRLEELLAVRALPRLDPRRAQAADDLARTHSLHFWFRSNSGHRAQPGPTGGSPAPDLSVTPGTSAPVLRRVDCELSPGASASTVAAQLRRLFRAGGIDDDFELPPAGGDAGSDAATPDDVLGAVGVAMQRHAEHRSALSSAIGRAEAAAQRLRSFGIAVCLEDHTGAVSLLTMPDDSGMASGSPALFSVAADLPAVVHQFLQDRGMTPFDIRSGGTATAVEVVCGALVKLATLFEQNRGHCMRGGVLFAFSAKAGAACRIAPDGSFVLPLRSPSDWADWLLFQPGPTWVAAQRQHEEWRSGRGARLNEYLRDWRRIADAFGVHSVVCPPTPLTSPDWAVALQRTFLKDVPAIRAAVAKHKIQGEVLRKRAVVRFAPSLASSRDPAAQITFRIQADGLIVFNGAQATTAQVLRVLRDNLAFVEKSLVRYDRVVASLEFLSRRVGARLTIDSEWKKRVAVVGGESSNGSETDFLSCLECFVAMATAAAGDLAPLLQRAAAGATAPSDGPSGSGGGAWFGLCLAVSDRFDASPSGVLCVPWDASFEGLKRRVLGR